MPSSLRPAPVAARVRRTATAAVAAAVAVLAAGCGENPVDPSATGPGSNAEAPAVGTVLRLNAYTDRACDTVRTGFRGGRVAAVSAHAIVVADTLNPAGGFTTADYASFAASFDSLAYPVDVRNFGEPTDLDRNGRVIIFFTSAVNALTPRGADYVVGGFFWNRDLFPKTGGADACAGSNDGELFYMLAPDPGGAVNGNARSKDYVARTSVGVLAHEFQHLINASRRLYVLKTDNFDEDVWLNEGLSHVAEELLFFRAAGQAPRTRLTLNTLRGSSTSLAALNAYNVQNLARVSEYLDAPETNSPYAPDDSLATRGATWSFLRYAADRTVAAGAARSDSAFFYRLVNSTQTGIPNLQAALSATENAPASLPDWFRDWSVANYADGTVTGLDVRFTEPSWVFRDVLPGLSSNNGAYPLNPRIITTDGAQTLVLDAGGTAYLRFAAPVGGQATVNVAGAGSRAAANLRLSLVGTGGTSPVTTYDPGTATVTASGGSGASASYTLVVFNGDTTVGARSTVTVTASGVGTFIASRAPVYTGPTLARLAGDGGQGADLPVSDAALNTRLRAIGAQELRGRIAAARAAYVARRLDNAP